ncbi:sodium:solute symporter family protein [Yunchengibacter salinarum]|uniref:sodium:solute symporter family protein n=1 Tax=Yunchengibacter salinarum TaxID=3133399 RepID=UPI0035B5C8BD
MLDLAIILAFVVYAVGSGFAAKKEASRDLVDYFLAGRTITGWRAGFSMAATQFAADTPLIVMGLMATGGIFLVWRFWVYGLAFLMLGFLIAARWRRANVLTDAELTETRYSGRGLLGLRALKAVYYGTVINCTVMAFVIVAAVRVAEVFLPWHLWLPEGLFGALSGAVSSLGMTLTAGSQALDPVTATTNNVLSIALMLIFISTYSVTGGLRSVIATDVAQFMMALVGTAGFAWVVVAENGGLGNMLARMENLYGIDRVEQILSFSPGAGEALVPFIAVMGLQWFFQVNADGTGYLAQRSMACKTDRDARIAAVVFTWMQVVVRSLFWLIIGIGLMTLFPFDTGATVNEAFKSDREMTFILGIDQLLPPGIKGLMLTGMLAALASTIDTHLNWGASYYSNDLYKRILCQHYLKREPDNKELVLVARLSNILILGIALFIMTQLGSIQTGWQISLLFGAGVGGVIVLRWFWERINLYSEIAAMAVSLVLGLFLLTFLPGAENDWLRLVIMAFGSTATAILVAYVTPATNKEKLVAFYRQVRPAGFWKKTAEAAGEDPRLAWHDLKAGTIATLTTALSIFTALVGLSKLIMPSPGEGIWFPILLLVISAALVPVWWRYGQLGKAHADGPDDPLARHL